MIDPSTKEIIDSMDYEHMLRVWRFAPIGADLLCGEVGDYFKRVLLEKKNMLLHDDQVRTSKIVGWE